MSSLQSGIFRISRIDPRYNNNSLQKCMRLIEEKAFLLSKIQIYIDVNAAVTLYNGIIFP